MRTVQLAQDFDYISLRGTPEVMLRVEILERRLKQHRATGSAMEIALRSGRYHS